MNPTQTYVKPYLNYKPATDTRGPGISLGASLQGVNVFKGNTVTAAASMPNTNPDFLYYWSKARFVQIGIDFTRGTDGHGNPSQIEDWYKADGKIVWMQPKVRVDFHTNEEALTLHARLESDLGYENVGALEQAIEYDTTQDPLHRICYRVPLFGQLFELGAMRALTTGIDMNGFQVYSADEYAISVDGPGTYTFGPFDDGNLAPGAGPGFVPKRK